MMDVLDLPRLARLLDDAAREAERKAAHRGYAKTSYKLLEKIDGSPRESEIVAQRHAEIDAEIAEHRSDAAALRALAATLVPPPDWPAWKAHLTTCAQCTLGAVCPAGRAILGAAGPDEAPWLVTRIAAPPVPALTPEDRDDLAALAAAYDWDTIHGDALARQARLPALLAKLGVTPEGA